MKLMIYFICLISFCIGYQQYQKNIPQFKVGDCVYSDFFELTKQVTGITWFNYEYDLYTPESSNDIWLGTFIMRKPIFNKLHKKVKCPKKGE